MVRQLTRVLDAAECRISSCCDCWKIRLIYFVVSWCMEELYGPINRALYCGEVSVVLWCVL